MKRALIVTTVSGFVPQFVMNHVRILQRMGYEVHYASNFHNPHYGSDNQRLEGTGIICHQIDFVRSPFRVWSNLKAYRQLRKLLKENSFQMMHCHTPMGGVLGRLAAKSEKRKKKKSESKSRTKTDSDGMKVFYTAHGFHFFQGAPIINWFLYYPIEWWLAGITDVLITITEEDYQQAKKWKRMKQEQVYHIHGVGIEIKHFQRVQQSKSQLRVQLGIEEDAILFLSTGELNRNKNHITMIRALSQIRDGRMYYLICGEGKRRKKLQRQIKRLGLEKQILLLGYQKEIRLLLQCADVYVCLSYREGLSLGIQEAMAAGLPVIASDIRGNRELILHGDGGWLVKPFDQTTLCEILKKIQKSTSLKFMKNKGEFNQERIKAYHVSVTEKEMMDIYRENGIQ